MLLLSFYYDAHMFDKHRVTLIWRGLERCCSLDHLLFSSLNSNKSWKSAPFHAKVTQPRAQRTFSYIFLWRVGGAWGCLSPSLHDTLPLHCCPQHLHGAVTNCPRKSLRGPQDPPFIFPDSNLVLALLHTCHCVFFLTLEAGGKRTVINGATSSHHGSFIIVW